jgi:uncharacterized membrane protein
MTFTTEPTDIRVESYLNRLEAQLAGLPTDERQDIVREIRAHILDRTACNPGCFDETLARVLHLLGTPEQLAQRYKTERLLTRAGSSFSPWLLLATTWRWAKLGLKGTLAFFVAVIGYGAAFALTVAVLLKPLMPSRVGMWSGQGNFFIGVPVHRTGMHEVLGQSFIPVVVVLAFVAAVGTTFALRWIIRTRSSKPAY